MVNLSIERNNKNVKKVKKVLDIIDGNMFKSKCNGCEFKNKCEIIDKCLK